MKRVKSSDISGRMKRRIISVAYGDAGLIDRLILFLGSLGNPEIKTELKMYRETAKTVRSLGEDSCPDEVLNRIKGRSIPVRVKDQAFLSDLAAIIINKPLASALTTIIFITVVAAAIIFNRPVEKTFTQQEIAAADKQARYALQLIGSIMSQTEQTLKKEILSDRVASPIRQGIDIVNSLIKEK